VSSRPRFIAVLVTLSVVLGAQGATAHESLTHWFGARTCPALDGLFSKSGQQPPYVKSGNDYLIMTIPAGVTRLLKYSMKIPWYVYDPRSGVALSHIGGDSGVMETLRIVGKPPVHLPQVDLSGAHTMSGLKLGATSAAVLAALGKPLIIRRCGMERYEYTNSRVGEPNDLDFTIRRGRVIEIFETDWG
jgi:hypothetical protein